MKKNFLIMLLTVFCAGFAFAQDDNTVRGFVPGGSTGNGNDTYRSYSVFGQVFGNIVSSSDYEFAEGLAQAQLVGDTVELAVGCGDSVNIGPFTLTADSILNLFPNCASPRDTFFTFQVPNVAVYNYDSLKVLHLFVCPCTVLDGDGNNYEVFAMKNLCWTKSNMRAANTCENYTQGSAIDSVMAYSTETTPSLDTTTYGLFYTWNAAIQGAVCDSNNNGLIQGICPCGWHIPTADEVDSCILHTPTNDLRAVNPEWVLPDEITNSTKFSAQPAGYFNYAADRFEGYRSEADFWYLSANCTGASFQILYYCDMPKTEPRNVAKDAMSVRCVLDMIYNYKNNIALDYTKNCRQ